MDYFKVLVISVSGAGKTIHNHGDIVPENQFAPGAADSYVKSGHIKKVKAPKGTEEKDTYDGPPLEELQTTYLELSGADNIPKNWGINALTKKIEALKAEALEVLKETYLEAGGEATDEERKQWDNEKYEAEITGLEEFNEAVNTYIEKGGKATEEERAEWTTEKYQEEIKVIEKA